MVTGSQLGAQLFCIAVARSDSGTKAAFLMYSRFSHIALHQLSLPPSCYLLLLLLQGMHDFSMADVLREVEVLYTIGGHPGM